MLYLPSAVTAALALSVAANGAASGTASKGRDAFDALFASLFAGMQMQPLPETPIATVGLGDRMLESAPRVSAALDLPNLIVEPNSFGAILSPGARNLPTPIQAGREPAQSSQPMGWLDPIPGRAAHVQPSDPADSPKFDAGSAMQASSSSPQGDVKVSTIADVTIADVRNLNLAANPNAGDDLGIAKLWRWNPQIAANVGGSGGMRVGPWTPRVGTSDVVGTEVAQRAPSSPLLDPDVGSSEVVMKFDPSPPHTNSVLGIDVTRAAMSAPAIQQTTGKVEEVLKPDPSTPQLPPRVGFGDGIVRVSLSSSQRGLDVGEIIAPDTPHKAASPGVGENIEITTTGPGRQQVATNVGDSETMKVSPWTPRISSNTAISGAVRLTISNPIVAPSSGNGEDIMKVDPSTPKVSTDDAPGTGVVRLAISNPIVRANAANGEGLMKVDPPTSPASSDDAVGTAVVHFDIPNPSLRTSADDDDGIMKVDPPTPPASSNDVVSTGVVTPQITSKDLVSTGAVHLGISNPILRRSTDDDEGIMKVDLPPRGSSDDAVSTAVAQPIASRPVLRLNNDADEGMARPQPTVPQARLDETVIRAGGQGVQSNPMLRLDNETDEDIAPHDSPVPQAAVNDVVSAVVERPMVSNLGLRLSNDTDEAIARPDPAAAQVARNVAAGSEMLDIDLSAAHTDPTPAESRTLRIDPAHGDVVPDIAEGDSPAPRSLAPPMNGDASKSAGAKSAASLSQSGRNESGDGEFRLEPSPPLRTSVSDAIAILTSDPPAPQSSRGKDTSVRSKVDPTISQMRPNAGDANAVRHIASPVPQIQEDAKAESGILQVLTPNSQAGTDVGESAVLKPVSTPLQNAAGGEAIQVAPADRVAGANSGTGTVTMKIGSVPPLTAPAPISGPARMVDKPDDRQQAAEDSSSDRNTRTQSPRSQSNTLPSDNPSSRLHADQQSKEVARDVSQAPQSSVSDIKTNAPVASPTQLQVGRTLSDTPALRTDFTAQQATSAPPAIPANVAVLAARIAATVKAGDKHFDIHLDPPDYGRVNVRLTVDPGGRAQAHVTADKPETLNLLQRDSMTLHKALKDSGLDLQHNSLNFSLKGQERGDGGAQRYPARAQLPPAADETLETPHFWHPIGSDAPHSRLDIRV